ncbi:MAG: 4-hydroxythreonine-4-phosphate dehydrogenase PdxA [Gemmatimonadales bacterium]
MTPRIAVTLGDPRGIGPEIVEKALPLVPSAEWVVIGQRGAGNRERAGMEVRRQVETAVRMAMSGEVEAIVTGPAEKAALHAAGVAYPGHTEWLGALAGGVPTAMMLAVPGLRVVLATTHVALRQVPDLLTIPQLVSIGTITRSALINWFGIPEPRLALCALNPHVGEEGAFGDEDDRVLRPAAEMMGATGPLPADTVFVKAMRGVFDAVIAPYHDVGMTAVKVAGFGRGVNITLGLPFIRTAPDHGTAMDIAGRDIADPSSMREALTLAVELVGRRQGFA